MHLGLGSLYRDQFLKQKAMEQLTKAYDLTKELINIQAMSEELHLTQ